MTLTDTLDLDASVSTFVAGAATRYGIGVNVGLTWRFLEPRLPSAIDPVGGRPATAPSCSATIRQRHSLSVDTA